MIHHLQWYPFLTCLWCVGCMRVYFRLKRMLCVLHHYLVCNISMWLLVLYFMYQFFSGLINTIQSGWIIVEKPICDNRSLSILFNKFTCTDNPVDNIRLEMILWWNPSNALGFKYMLKIFIYVVINLLISSILLKGIHKYSLKIRDIFWGADMENGLLV